MVVGWRVGWRLGGGGTGSWIGLWLTLMTGVLLSKWTSNAVNISLTFLFSLAHEMLTKSQSLLFFLLTGVLLKH